MDKKQKEQIKKAIEDIQSGKKNKVTITLKDNEFNVRPLPLLWYSKTIFFLQQWMVPMHLKNWLLRTAGLNVGHDACIPHYMKFDPYFPQLTYIGAGALVGGDSKLLSHKLEGKKLTIGRVELKENSMIAGFVALMPGAVINRNSMVSFNTDLDHEIPEGEIWVGKPAKLMVKLDQDQINKYFKKLDMDPKQYYKEAREKIRKFQKDPSINYLKIQYGGKRAGAGNDWWRARNVARIFYNGPIIELARILPNCWPKKILLKMVGVKIGKNVYIGKGCVFDHIYCDTITLEDDVRAENDCYFDGHEYTIAQTVFGRVLIKKGVHIKHNTFIKTGTTIGENTTIEPWSMCGKEIPPNEVWGGFPAKHIRKK
ncbi:MAG: hypothetical protein NT001_01625 [Candidatus Woesearchaeota archaeon]|nr:hypothetical protein [Candidatus Woesearchaeota archaeon]